MNSEAYFTLIATKHLQAANQFIKMIGKRIILSIPLLLSIFPSYGLADPSNPLIIEREAAPEAEPNVEAFQKLLNEVDPPALHSALHEHSPKKFAHGMFREDRIAVEAIHREDPPLAQSIVILAKRQVSNSTAQSSSAPPAATSTSSLEPTSGSTPVTALASPAVSSTPGSATASATTKSATTSTASSGSQTQVTSAKFSATTTLPTRTSIAVQTSTLSNGSRSVVTQTTLLGGEVLGTTPTGSAGVQGSSTPSPGLQTGAATGTGNLFKEILCVFGVAVGMAMLI